MTLRRHHPFARSTPPGLRARVSALQSEGHSHVPTPTTPVRRTGGGHPGAEGTVHAELDLAGRGEEQWEGAGLAHAAPARTGGVRGPEGRGTHCSRAESVWPGHGRWREAVRDEAGVIIHTCLRPSGSQGRPNCSQGKRIPPDRSQSEFKPLRALRKWMNISH